MRGAFGCVLAILFASAPLAAFAQERTVEQAVVSPANPAARIIVAPSHTYLGQTTAVVMDNQATAQRFWFAHTEDGRVTSAVIVHFEHWNDGFEGAFRYPTFRMERFGSHEYLHQSFPMEGCPVLTAEARAMLRSQGVSAAQHCVATRFVRATDADLRHELIFFYLELVDALPDTTGLGQGGLPTGYDQPSPPDSPWARIERRLTDALRATVRVVD